MSRLISVLVTIAGCIAGASFVLFVIPWAVESRWGALVLALILLVVYLRLRATQRIVTREEFNRITSSTTREK